MIDLGTIAGLHARDHELHAYCAACDRWSVLPLARMIADGMGQRRLPLRVRLFEDYLACRAAASTKEQG